jgi:hypothetical protein
MPDIIAAGEVYKRTVQNNLTSPAWHDTFSLKKINILKKWKIIKLIELMRGMMKI